MRHYAPRKRQTDGKWDYTCRLDDYIYPVGYCNEYREFNTDLIHVSESEIKEYAATKDKHHTHGHDTEEEACNCYREYLLDHRLRLGRKWDGAQHQCKVCGEWTQGYAEIDMKTWDLCDQHNNRTEVEKLFEAPSWSWES